MRPYRIGEIAAITGARILHGSPDREIRGAISDSRRVAPRDLFCSIRGERVDGHDFVLDVFRRGAGGAFVEEQVPGLLESLLLEDPGGEFGLLEVPSTIKALQALASSYRGELSSKVIGITGSVGKTGTKDLVCSVLATHFSVFGNPGNLNSHIGMPLAVLRIDGSPDYAVLEMAMRAKGEITELCAIALPEIGILTDVSMSHIGILGSIEKIAAAKSEILTCLPPNGRAVVSGDNEWVLKVSRKWGRRFVSYGLTEGCDVRGLDVISLGAQGSGFSVALSESLRKEARASYPAKMEFRLHVPGLHQVHNALAAVAVGMLTGIPCEKIRWGLENAVMSPMRLQILERKGITVINDAYNASPKSMRSALNLLAETGSGRKIAVLGDMRELGDFSPEAHREVGEYARTKATRLACTGDLAKDIIAGWNATGGAASSSWFSSKDELTEFLLGFLKEGDTCLIKASRGMGFETVVSAVLGGAEEGHDGH